MQFIVQEIVNAKLKTQGEESTREVEKTKKRADVRRFWKQSIFPELRSNFQLKQESHLNNAKMLHPNLMVSAWIAYARTIVHRWKKLCDE